MRFHQSPRETAGMNTRDLRANFLVEELMRPDHIELVYSQYDRLIIGGAVPLRQSLVLPNPGELKASHFLERREMGVINVGGPGVITADGISFESDKLDGIYLGKGTREVFFVSKDESKPAYFYFLSAPAHQAYPNARLTREQASPVSTGDALNANRRTIYKYIHEAGIPSSQLVMGLTVLEAGSVWNTMPAHTHTRRTEIYFYFDVAPEARVFHFMGEPQETRHLLVANHQALISPPWSIHSGCGTANYGFIWGMAGENYTYTDMDPVPVRDLK